MKKVDYFFLGLFFAATLLYSHAAFADQQGVGFSINPFYQTIDIQKDQPSAPFSVEVKNNTSEPAVFRISVLDFGTLDESGGVAFLGSSDNLKYGLASWVSLPNDTLVLVPGESQTVTGTIENRESLSPGGHYGAVFFKIEDDNNAANQNDQIAFNPSFASLLFVRKVGGETYGLHLDSEDFSKNIFVFPSLVRLRFQNTGNVHVTPRGDVEIYDPAHRLVAKSIINAESSIILPETFRVFPGKFIPRVPVFLPGRYTMITKYRYDSLDIFADSSQTFFLVPPLFIAFVIGASMLIFAVVRFRLKKVKTANIKT